MALARVRRPQSFVSGFFFVVSAAAVFFLAVVLFDCGSVDRAAGALAFGGDFALPPPHATIPNRASPVRTILDIDPPLGEVECPNIRHVLGLQAGVLRARLN
jgi:hypothetical protein